MYEFCVEVAHPDLSRLVQQRALEKGYTWAGRKQIGHLLEPWIVFGSCSYNDKNMWTSDGDDCKRGECGKILSLAEVLQKFNPFFKVGKYEILFRKGLLEIGCQRIPNETIRKILAKLN